MQQQINLLTDDLRRRKEPLTFANMLLIWAVFSGVLVLFTGWDGVDLYRLSSRQAEGEEQTQLLVEANRQLKAQFDGRLDIDLEKEVEKLRARQAERRQLMTLLLGYRAGREDGFSPFLEDLAEHAVDDMWLSQITVEQGGERIVLKGMTTDPLRLPEFLQRLSRAESFRGQRFDAFELREGDAGVLEFDITGPSEEA